MRRRPESGKGQGRILRREDFCPSWGWKDWPEGGQRNSGKQSFQGRATSRCFLLAGVPEIIHSWWAGRAVDSLIILPAGSPLSTAPGQRAWVFLPSSQPFPSAMLILNLWPPLFLAGRGQLTAPLDEQLSKASSCQRPGCLTAKQGRGWIHWLRPSTHAQPLDHLGTGSGELAPQGRIWICSSSGQRERGRRASQQPQQP